MQRDAQGKFALKNDEHRSVRSLRLTDTTWSALGGIAESLGITRADYLEQMFRSNDDQHPSNTRQEELDQPSNTRQEEIEWLLAQVAHLREENAFLLEQVTGKQSLLSELEAARERVLSSLKLGKQAPGYKRAKSVINQFIALLHSRI